MTTVICIVGVCSTPVRSEVPGVRPTAASSVAAEVVDLTNVERTARGRARLRANPRLMRAGHMHAEQMARAGQLAHVLPDAAYPRAADRLAAADYRWQTYGENVALGQSSAAAALD
ncbi:MAG: CAP domain-containing protein, partial [Vicinamibacterales bacterium]